MNELAACNRRGFLTRGHRRINRRVFLFHGGDHSNSTGNLMVAWDSHNYRSGDWLFRWNLLATVGPLRLVDYQSGDDGQVRFYFIFLFFLLIRIFFIYNFLVFFNVIFVLLYFFLIYIIFSYNQFFLISFFYIILKKKIPFLFFNMAKGLVMNSLNGEPPT